MAIMKLSDFDYQLPRDLIAQSPVLPRDHSRLMVVHRATGVIEDCHFYDMPNFLLPHDVLVFNNSKVVPARILFTSHGTKCELFFVRSVQDDLWEVMVRPGRFFQVGRTLQLSPDVTAEVVHVDRDGTHLTRTIRVRDARHRPAYAVLDALGSTPLPPYISHSPLAEKNYQTIYASEPGSVAAPTAGFHFTNELFDSLCQRNVSFAYVTLHVGPGTFRPVHAEDVITHPMHEESFSLSDETAAHLSDAKSHGQRIIAVGTTATRVLESCADHRGMLHAQTGHTKIFIYPGYHWRFVDALITNFHLPKSTLLMLVSSFAGHELIMRAYQKAIKLNYRFYSFGDGMLIL